VNKQTICIIDDNDSFRDSTKWLLTGMGHCVSEFRDPVEGLNALRSGLHCDCLLMDVRMPSMSGLDVHDKLLESDIAVPVVYMTGHGAVALAVEAMKKGAVTFLEKPIDADALSSALNRASSFHLHRIGRKQADQKVTEFQNRLKKLTPREAEVMQSIVDGKANKVIAFDLGISQKTVELHRSRVMKKLPIRSPQELVKFVMLSQ